MTLAEVSASAYIANILPLAPQEIYETLPKADEIIRELGKQLNEGIVTLLEAAKYEHKDIDVMKHLLATASFAKKFSDPS